MSTLSTCSNGQGIQERWDLISRHVRSSMGLGRDKFARLLQVTPRTVMRWENGTESERAIPQGIQRMKLLALALDENDEQHRQEILGDLLDQASAMRSDYESRATTIRRYQIDLGGPAPAWLDDMVRLKREKNWSALALLGPHFLPSGDGPAREMSPTLEALLCLGIGLAQFMQGQPLKAIQYYERGLAQADMPTLVRCVLLANAALAAIRLRRFEQAAEQLDDCLQLDPSHLGALRNRLVLHAQTDDDGGFLEAAHQLLERHPEAGDPDSELGQAIREDPDLSQMVRKGIVQQAFPSRNVISIEGVHAA